MSPGRNYLSLVCAASAAVGANAQSSFSFFSSTWSRDSAGVEHHETHEMSKKFLEGGQASAVSKDVRCDGGKCKETVTISGGPETQVRFPASIADLFDFFGGPAVDVRMEPPSAPEVRPRPELIEVGPAQGPPPSGFIVVKQPGIFLARGRAVPQHAREPLPQVKQAQAPDEFPDWQTTFRLAIGPFAAMLAAAFACLKLCTSVFSDDIDEAPQRPLRDLAQPLAATAVPDASLPEAERPVSTLKEEATSEATDSTECTVAAKTTTFAHLPSVGSWLLPLPVAFEDGEDEGEA